jgi:hypothetical protein
VAIQSGPHGCLFDERHGSHDGSMLFGHLDGEEKATGNPGVDGTSAMPSPRSRWRPDSRTMDGYLWYRVCECFLGERLAF